MLAFEARAERAGGIAFFLQAAYAAADGHLWSDAERLLKKVIEQAPGCVDAYVKLGLVFECQERLKEARAALERALVLEERQPVLTLLGSIQRRLGDTAAAVATLRRSVSLDPNDDDAHHGLGLSLKETEPEEAIRHFQQALDIDPSHPHSHREMGMVLWKLQRLDDAFRAFQNAIHTAPDDAWAHDAFGHVLQREGRLEEAKGEFLRSTELEPASGFFWANLGRAAFELVEFDEAERYFRKGLSVELDEPVLCREYGALLKATGRLSKARRYLERALRLDPGDRRARSLLLDLDAYPTTRRI